MDIEIVTTKKKLTMSIVNQMPRASHADIRFAMMDPAARILGYINDYKYEKYKISVAIIKTPSDWAVWPIIETKMRSVVNREQHPDGEMYHQHEVEYFYTYKQIGNIQVTSKKSTDKAEIEGKIKQANELVKFAKREHIYL
ncbi:Hypothetical protein KNT65_gp106 [Escherichia phage EcS1]|uniref:Uncharacterized protein n=1 Tax=Escherichia phage EcS1 TaxID=2083276 RepID=A0A2Z5ZCG5_9CAUD|nr:Hypothetical protein KNT65_gp106 [Escherichia phage EcS1]BBC78154.1 Hypothetical protein [Escherichia phage EcS1]